MLRPIQQSEEVEQKDMCGRVGEITHRIVMTHLIFFKVVLVPPQVLHRVQLGRRLLNLLL